MRRLYCEQEPEKLRGGVMKMPGAGAHQGFNGVDEAGEITFREPRNGTEFARLFD